jgi:hypothetical protein
MSDVPPNYSLLDELLAEDDILDDVVSEVTSVMKASVEALQVHQKGTGGGSTKFV